MSYINKGDILYPEIKDLEKQVQFQSEDGYIWLHEQRSLLLSVSALGSLWRELFNTVGQERAKGFLLRLGYQLGLKDADLARHSRPNSKLEDIFLAGPQLHSLRGMVKVNPIDLEFNIEKGTFFSRIIWENSYEVEICRSEIGIMKEPSCWTLIGYACAYASSFMGKPIIYQEISCRSCGDTQCVIEGRPAEDWPFVDDFIKNFKADPVIEELYELQSQISLIRDKDYLEDSHLINGVGCSSAYKKVVELINKAGKSDISVLLLGETGVGKEVVAKTFHQRSERAQNPFIAINCAAIPSDLLEAELFGVEKGAFTGATQSRMGRFERAHKGTIFLDEVVELTPKAQASLLRVLQENELERVGGTEVRKVDVRVIAATNEDLGDAVQEGKFRADLYYRLNVYPVTIPPLRERIEDIPLLVDFFIKKYEIHYNKKTLGISDRALDMLCSYNWPGNIRELENIIERGVLLTDNNDTLCVDNIFPMSAPSKTLDQKAGPQRMISDSGHLDTNSDSTWVDQVLESNVPMDDIERTLLEAALLKSNGNVSKASKLVGMTRPAFAYRLTKFGIDV